MNNVIAKKQNALAEVMITEQDMVASIKVTGAYAGLPLVASDIIKLLADAQVVKGINKKALNKVLYLSNMLSAGETYVQPVAVGKRAKEGRDTRFIPLVADPKARVLRPQETSEQGKVDMRDLGAMITVGEGDPLMKRVPSVRGIDGYTVKGETIPPKEVKDLPLKESPGTSLSSKNPNILVATIPGMPLIKKTSVEITEALILSNVDISTGHIRFKGSIIISGNIEAGMIVSASGNVSVGGFIESANVKAKGDIVVGEGIIGRNVEDDEAKTCTVQAGGDVHANYAQYSTIKAKGEVNFNVHSFNNDISCGGDLTVVSDVKKQGVLSGGEARIGGKVICNHLGVEGDTATYIHAFASYQNYVSKLELIQQRYTDLQQQKIDSLRREMELKKIPNSQRTEEQNEELAKIDNSDNTVINETRMKREKYELELSTKLERNIVESYHRTHTRVTVVFGDERVITKHTHGPVRFSFDKYSIKVSSKMKEEDIAV